MAMHRVGWAAVAMVCAAGAALAETRWLKATSGGFELFTTANERRARDVIVYFERVRGFFSTIAPASSKDAATVRIIAFSSDKEFRPYRPSEVAAAFAASWNDRNYISLSGTAADQYPAAVHEYVHILLRPSGDKIPLWLNEGLAELYSSLRPLGKKVVIGDIKPGWYQALQTKGWLSLETLTAVGRDSPYYNEKTRATVFYAESWVLTHMLLLTEQYRSKFPQFLALAAKGDQRAAFEQAFGKTLMDVWDDLQAYMRKSQFNAGVFDVPLPKSAEEPEVREATPLETGVVLAELLEAAHKNEEAVQALKELAKQYPKSPEVEETIGYADLTEGDLGEAAEHFERATELGSTNAKVYFDCATLIQRGDKAESKLIPLLRKAVALDPEFSKARYFLGISLANRQQYEEAIEHLERIKRVNYEEGHALFLTLAYAYERTGKHAEAIRAAERAKTFARSDDQKIVADRLIESLKEPDRQTTVRSARSEPVEEDEEPSPPRTQATPARAPHVIERTPEPKDETVEGILDQVDCLGKRARLRLRVAGRPVRLIIDDPSKVDVRGMGGANVEFGCGPQPGRKVEVHYDPKLDGELGTVGAVKWLEFK